MRGTKEGREASRQPTVTGEEGRGWDREDWARDPNTAAMTCTEARRLLPQGIMLELAKRKQVESRVTQCRVVSGFVYVSSEVAAAVPAIGLPQKPPVCRAKLTGMPSAAFPAAGGRVSYLSPSSCYSLRRSSGQEETSNSIFVFKLAEYVTLEDEKVIDWFSGMVVL